MICAEIFTFSRTGVLISTTYFHRRIVGTSNCYRTFCLLTNTEASQIAGVPVLKSPPWNQTITGHRSSPRFPTCMNCSLINVAINLGRMLNGYAG